MILFLWMENSRLNESELEGMEWIDLAHDLIQYGALVNTVMNLRVP